MTASVVERIERLSATEYLASERASTIRHELLDGERVEMVGASERHNWIVTNLVRELAVRLKETDYRTYSSDMRVQVAATGDFLYPDVVVARRVRDSALEPQDILRDPILIAEVLSPSTEAHDRGRKLLSYQAIPTLQHYLLVSQDQPHVEHLTRQGTAGWSTHDVRGLDQAVEVLDLGCEAPMAEIYFDVFH